MQSKVRDLFRSLERPVIVQQRDERKRIEAQVALGGVVKTCVFFLLFDEVVGIVMRPDLVLLID